MLSQQWLKHHVVMSYNYWETRISADELRDKCIKHTLEMIRSHENEDPEQYRAYVETCVDRTIQFAETGE